MRWYTLSFCVILLILGCVGAEDSQEGIIEENNTVEMDDANPDKQIHRPPIQNEDLPETDIQNAIEKFENIVKHSKRQIFEDVPKEDHDNMLDLLNTIIDSVVDSHKAYTFLQSKGIDRVIASNMQTTDPELQTHHLILLKVLFDVAPTTTRNVIPAHVVDNVMDIFENEDIDLKAHALDILDAWLPRNPKIQTRVMRLAGLQPFYEQIEKLDTTVAKTLLNMFNKILVEHLKVRNEPGLVNDKTRKMYRQIGLIEHISTPGYCKHLFSVFARFWTYNTNENNIIFTIFELMGNVKPLCIKYFPQKLESKELFTKLMEYVQDPENVEHLQAHGVNVTEVSIVIKDYIDKMGDHDKRAMDEL